MRIAMLIGSLREGGAEGQLVLLARELRARGHDVTILLLHEEGVRLAGVRAEGFEVFPVRLPRFRPRWSPAPWWQLLAARRRTMRYLEDWKPDILHAWLFWAHLWGRLCLGSVPLITSRLETPAYEGLGGRLRLSAERWINRSAAGVWANSTGAAKAAVAMEGNLPKRRVVLRNGIKLDAIHSAPPIDLRREFPALADAGPIAIIVASLLPVKAHDLLLRAWVRVRERHPNAALLCVGADGGEGARLEQLRFSLKLEGCVVFAGGRADVPGLIKGADLGVLCSHSEGLSNAMLECMALGRPFVSTDVNGAREVIRHGENGLIVPCSNREALAGAIIRIMDDPAVAQRLGEAGARTVAEGFGAYKFADGYLRFLSSITES